MDANLLSLLIVVVIVLGILGVVYMVRDRFRRGNVKLDVEKGNLDIGVEADAPQPRAAANTPPSSSTKPDGIQIDNNQIATGGKQKIETPSDVNLSVTGNKVGKAGEQNIKIGNTAKAPKRPNNTTPPKA